MIEMPYAKPGGEKAKCAQKVIKFVNIKWNTS